MDLGPVSQGGDWMRRCEPLLTGGNAGCRSPLRLALRRERLIEFRQVVRHMLSSRGEVVLALGIARPKQACLTATCWCVKSLTERLFSASQARNLTYIEYTIIGNSVKYLLANLG
jgi:hypothetical protein